MRAKGKPSWLKTLLNGAAQHSVRRALLDRDLTSVSGALAGVVLEIGNGRAGRRGTFRPQTDGIGRRILLDKDARRMPDVRGDAACLAIRSGSVDAVVSLEVLEYVWTPAMALNEMWRALKPGGMLVMSTPFLHRVDAPDDYWHPTEPALRRLLAECGFDVLE